MINENQHADSPDPKSDLALRAKQTVQDVMSIILSARKALGKARLATATKAAEFMRVIVGDEKTKVAEGGGYYCQDCFTQPVYDYHWTKAERCDVANSAGGSVPMKD